MVLKTRSGIRVEFHILRKSESYSYMLTKREISHAYFRYLPDQIWILNSIKENRVSFSWRISVELLTKTNLRQMYWPLRHSCFSCIQHTHTHTCTQGHTHRYTNCVLLVYTDSHTYKHIKTLYLCVLYMFIHICINGA